MCLNYCIFPVECSQFPMAADLAEKYGDFQILVQLCEHLNSRDKLRAYMRRFADQVCALHISRHGICFHLILFLGPSSECRSFLEYLAYIFIAKQVPVKSTFHPY